MATKITQEIFTKNNTYVSNVSVDYKNENLGIGSAMPLISWTFESNEKNWLQTAYEIALFDETGKLLVTTSKVDSNRSSYVAWPFGALRSRECRQIQVRCWGDDKEPCPWSNEVSIETGLLEAMDWKANFISPDWQEDISQGQPAPLLRRDFEMKKTVVKARLYITSLGVFEALINGKVIGDHVLDPGWTSYSHRLRYQTFDVTELLTIGKNAIGVMVGDGWYRGRLGFGGGRRNFFGERLALLAQLEVQYDDGSTDVICTDSDWRCSTGPILFSDIYDGEIYDARLEIDCWAESGFNDAEWNHVSIIDRDLSTLFAASSNPVRRIETRKPKEILTSPSGKVIIDFGQNLVGRLKISVKGETGRTITMKHAEVLENGELALIPLRTAKATDQYTLRGNGIEVWEPRFTFHGFRYAQIDNWPEQLSLDDVEAVVIHSDMNRSGWFECSDPMINQLHENVVWGMRGNFLDIPTDCPQRDERLGWTGDIQVFSPAACYLYDAMGFLATWLQDLAAEQAVENGKVPIVIPNTILYSVDMSADMMVGAAWSDAAVIVPWVLYQRYGDASILENQFDSMRDWQATVTELAGENRLWDTGEQLGDWLDPDAPPDKPAEGKTDRYLVASAYFAHITALMEKTCQVLGKQDEESYYHKLLQEIKTAFDNRYVLENGYLSSDSQTAYALAIEFDLFTNEKTRDLAGKRLAELTKGNGYHIGTGFVGTPLICDALSNTGHDEDAFKLLLQKTCPSWLYPVTMGATTVWERWDSMLPDGSINSGEMTSFNHYALGAVADWIHRKIGGLEAYEPGYKKLLFAPQPGGGITYASTKHMTPYGLASCDWFIKDGKFEMKVVIPPNTTAIVVLPGKSTEQIEVGSGEYNWQVYMNE